MKILVTGATGFVGSALLSRLEPVSTKLYALARRVPGRQKSPGKTNWLEHDLASSGSGPLQKTGDLDAVVHLAVRAHVLEEKNRVSLAEFRAINVEGTLKAARRAVEAGAGRFVFVSSVVVYGDHSRRPFTLNSPLNPIGAYAVSKLEAEERLREFADAAGMELVIIRPPLVYGPDAPGNFGRLVRIIRRGFPLPLGLVRNRRSLVALDNLVDLIMICLNHPSAAGQTFLVSDGEDLATPELIRRLARAMGRPARLLPVPPALLRLGGRLFGKEAEINRLLNSLQVDMSHTVAKLGWQPPVSVDEGLLKAVKGFQE